MSKKYWLAILAGILLSLSDAGIGFAPIAWVAIVPLFLALEKEKSSRSAFKIGYLCGFVFFSSTTYWIALLYPFAKIGNSFATNFAATGILNLALIAYLALYPAIFCGGIIHLKTGLPLIFSSAIIWTALEWVKSWMISGFPWGSLGYSQWQNLPAIQIASIVGVHGVSFLIVIVNGTIAHLIITRKSEIRWQQKSIELLPSVIIAMASFGFGFFQLNSPIKVAEKIEIALIPGNIRQIDKWQRQNFSGIFDKYIGLIEEVNESENPKLIVLPETAFPRAILFQGSNNRYKKRLFGILQKNDFSLLTGAPRRTADRKSYNSAFMLDRNGKVLGTYSKMHLVPFGEYTPLSKYMPNPIRPEKGFQPGTSYELFPVPESDRTIGTVICFESSFPNLARKFVKKGASAIGILVNDAWFEGTAAIKQHFSMAPFRAIENRVSVFRCANGGISCIIGPFGDVMSSPILPTSQENHLSGELQLHNRNNTIYTEYGDWFPILCFMATIGLMVGFRIHRSSRS